MNRKQRVVLAGAVVLVLLMMLFPPVSLPNGGSAGYAPIFLVERTRHVNLGLLVVQWVGVANVVALLYALLRDDAARGGGPRCVRAILPRSPEAGRWR